MHTTQISRLFTITGMITALGTAALAADGLATKLNIGATLTDGNSETMQANASLITEGEKEGLGALRAGIEANYGETTTSDDAGESTETTLENVRVFGGAKKTITERLFASLDAAALYDDIAKIDYRVSIAPGLGAYITKNDSTDLSVDIGPAYIWENVDGISDDYMAIRIGERLAYRFSETAKAWQSAEYLPTADDFNDYLLTLEIGAEAALNNRLNLRIVLQNKYDSTPGEGLEKNDLVLSSGISVTL
jgi:putative salt-induced outer membrane protein YdiY